MSRFERFVECSVDCLLLCQFFREIGLDGLNNGLSSQENKILFETKSLEEIRALVLSGLARLSRRPEEHALSAGERNSRTEAAFERSILGASQPRSSLIDFQRMPSVSPDELLSLEDELFAALGEDYLEARRSALSQCEPAILEQVGATSNARSMLSLDLAALNWRSARDDTLMIPKFLAELCATRPAISNIEAVRLHFPSGAVPLSAHLIEEITMTAWFEDLPLDWTRTETKRASNLLTTAYPTNAAALALAEDAGLDRTRLKQLEEVDLLMRDILGKARLSDRLTQLLAEVLCDPGREAVHEELRSLISGYEATVATAAMRRRPSIRTLATLPSSVEVLGFGKGQQITPDFEKLINQAAGFSDPAKFRLLLAEAEVRTARIDLGGKPRGTGFLVGPNLLLTNWHVVAGATQGGTAVFDNKVSPRGRGQQDPGRAVTFAHDWLVARSEHDSPSAELGPEGPTIGKLDFAVVRLSEPLGTQPIGPDPTIKDCDQRGWYRLDGNPYDFEETEPIFILGHPSGRPVQFSYASPSSAKATKNNNRVRYKTNTEGGSSGSPVFNRDWRVVALHHAAGPTSTPGEFNLRSGDFNQGIPISAIVTELKSQLGGRQELAELGL